MVVPLAMESGELCTGQVILQPISLESSRLLESADDRTIWQHAKERGLTIATKDEDFQALATRQGSIPPQVIWIRLGNCRKEVLLQAFSKILPALRAMLSAGDNVVEIR